MVNSISSIMYNLSLLNQKNEKVTYSMSSGNALQNGSDDSKQYNQILAINNNVKTYDSILNRIQSSTSFNNSSDSAVSSIKNSLESAQSLIIKALNDTLNTNDKSSVSYEIDSLKDTLLTLANSNVNGEYLFSGKNSSVKAFQKDTITGKITYTGSNDNKTLNVEKNSYITQGLNGVELFYYPKDSANTGSALTFSENEIISDEDGNVYKLLDNNSDGSFDGLYLNGDSSSTSISIINNGDNTYTINNSTSSILQSKHSIFDLLEDISNTLNQKDSLGNNITSDEANDLLSSLFEDLQTGYDYTNLAHSKLGTRISTIENYESIIETKLTHFNLLQEEYSSADLTKLAVESQSLENTYTALYSTINKINSLSLVNYLN